MGITLWCDESVGRDSVFSNFYGGVAVAGEHIPEISLALAKKKEELNFYGELKWVKVTENYLDKYMSIMDLFFCYIAESKIRARIMFTQNILVPNLTAEQAENQFHLLYYQFIKNAFGFSRTQFEQGTRLQINFDKLPDKKEKNERFKTFILDVINNDVNNGLILHRDDIAEVDSKKHDILQCLDIVLGSMAFRLNNKHRYIAPGEKRRGKRTVAKERLYKHIYAHISNIYPRFNIGISTAWKDGDDSLWTMPYRHWILKPQNRK